MRGRMMRRRRIRSREDERRMMETAWRVKEGWIERWMNMMMTRRIGRRRRRRAGRRRMRHESATYLIIQIRLVHCDETCVGGRFLDPCDRKLLASLDAEVLGISLRSL